jgi:hypothetical protein
MRLSVDWTSPDLTDHVCLSFRDLEPLRCSGGWGYLN